jgi:hypothetical protein
VPPCCRGHAAGKLAMDRVVVVDCVWSWNYVMQRQGSCCLIHSFSDDHCCRYITSRICLARPRGALSQLQFHARPFSAHGLPKRTPLDTRVFDRPRGRYRDQSAGWCGAAWCGAPCPVTTVSARRGRRPPPIAASCSGAPRLALQ